MHLWPLPMPVVGAVKGIGPMSASPPAGAVTPVTLPLLPTYWPLVTGAHWMESADGSARYTSAFTLLTSEQPRSLCTRTQMSNRPPGVIVVSVETELRSTGAPRGTRKMSGLSQKTALPKVEGV